MIHSSGRSDEYLIPDLSHFTEGGVARAFILRLKYLVKDQITLVDVTITITLDSVNNIWTANVELGWFNQAQETFSFTIDKSTADFLTVATTYSVAPNNLKDFYKMNVLFKVELTNSLHQYSKIYETLIVQTDTSKNLWDNSRFMQMSYQCTETSSGNDCSPTYNFGHVFISRANHGGYYPRELIPNDYYENNDASLDARCLVLGTSDFGISSTQCFHCMSVIDKDSSTGKWTYQSNDFHYCQLEPDTIAYPQLKNCELYTKSYSFEAACSKCKDGYSLNLFYDINEDNAINCVPDDQCTASSVGTHFESQTYPSGNTNQFCLSCPINCASCDDNLQCTDCTPEFATFDSVAKTCTCLVGGCSNCT